jgi:type I restriction enzyme S subunit
MAIPSLDRQLLSALSIPLPPFAEQTRIAQLLDEAFEAIAIATANAEKNLQNARDLIESHLRDSLTKSSEGWTQAKLGSIGQIQMCKRVLKNQTNTVSGVPFYKIGTFGKVADAFIPAELFEKFRRKYAYPMLGEVLISAAGTIGKRVVFDGAPSYFQDSNIVWLKNDESIILNSYLYYYYAICDFNPTKGTTINRLYNDDLRNLVISFPKSLATQRKLISRIEVLQSESGRLLGLYSLKLDQLLRLRQALLQQNFSERIRSA